MNVSRIEGLLTLRNYLLIICGAVQLFRFNSSFGSTFCLT